MATSDAKHGFNDLAYGRLKEYTNSSSLTLKLASRYVVNFLQGWASGFNLHVTLTDVAGNIEVCKVTSITGDNLTVSRGQDGTIAKNWPAGTLVSQRLVANTLGRIHQKGEERSVSYNPNGVLVANYPGEKIYQDGDSCHRRWWIHAEDNKWRLAAGTICADEYLDDGWIFSAQQLFCFGGRDDYDATDKYDPSGDAWSEKTDIYANKWEAAAASPSGASGINLFGGGTTGANSTQDNLRLETTLAYTVKTSMPSPARSAHMAVGNYDDYVYCFGGENYNTSTKLSDNDRYSESGDSWLDRQAVPSPARNKAAAGKPSLGEIYYTAGFDVDPTGDHDEYNETLDSWTAKTALSPYRSECCGVCDLDYFYISYGRTLGPFSNDMDYYYPTGDVWTALANCPDGGWYQVHGSGHDASGATYHVGGDQDGFRGTTREYFFGWSFVSDAPCYKGYHTMAQATGFSA